MNSDHVNVVIKKTVLLCLCLLTTSCGEPDNSYFPLAQGHDWRYRIQLKTMNGSETQKYLVSSLAPRVINSETIYIQRSLTGMEIMFRQTDTGISRVGFLVSEGEAVKEVADEQLLLPAEPAVGTEWDSTVRTQTLLKGNPDTGSSLQVQAKVPVSNRIESISERIKVPAGIFMHCIRVHTEGFTFYQGTRLIGRTLVEVDETKWYAPGVGLVKSVLMETTTSDMLSRGELIMELEAFK